MIGIDKEIHWKAVRVDYWPSTKNVVILFELDRRYRQEGYRYLCDFVFDVSYYKFLKGKTEEEVAKISLRGDKVVQWEELGIQIDLDDLLMSIQLRENWLNNLK